MTATRDAALMPTVAPLPPPIAIATGRLNLRVSISREP